MANGKVKRAKCQDCFFHRNMLCALDLPSPCATYRHVDRGLAPERQLEFGFRVDRTRAAAYAFPRPR